MAFDWIKMRSDLYRDPKVVVMADVLMDEDGELAAFISQNCQRNMTVTRNVTRNACVGALLSVWGVMRHQGTRVGDDLKCRNVTVSVIDDIADMPGFGDAMKLVEWVIEEDDSIVFPGFFREYNVEPERKEKSKNAERQARYREKLKSESDGESNVTRNVTRNVTVTPREEKRREENKEDTPLPPKGETDEQKPVVVPSEQVPQEPTEEPVQFPESVSDVCEAWLDYKRQRRQGYKPRGLKSFAATVEKAVAAHGVNAVREALEKAMSDNYQGWTHNLQKANGNNSGKTWGQQRQQNMVDLMAKLKAQDEAGGQARIGQEAGK